MEDYPEEITSSRANQVRGHDVFSPSKKRKFLNETKEQLSLQESKYICCERDSFSKQSLQTRKGKAPLQEVEEETQTREESMQDSNSTGGESFSQSTKASSYDESCLTSSQQGRETSGDAFCSMDSTTVSGSCPGDDEVQDRIREEKLDEFGHCLAYLGSACGSDSTKPQTDEELEEFLYSNGMIPRSCLHSSESLTAEQEAQSCTGKATIDQEFEQYFSLLML